MSALMLVGVMGASVAEGASPATRSPAPPRLQPPPRSTAAGVRDSVVEVASGIFRIGGVTIDTNQRKAIVRGHVNMAAGLIELLACTPYGKTYESALVLDAQPYHIQVGLLLLGLEPTLEPLRFQGDSLRPTGDPVQIRVSWRDSAGTTTEVPAEDLVLDQRSHRSMARGPWIFTGSRVENGVFRAQLEGTIITTYRDPATIIDNANDGGSDDTVYTVNEAVIPDVKTPVTLTIVAVGPPRQTPDPPEKK